MTTLAIIKPKPKVLTEDLGKILEYAICSLYDTNYVGNFKYSKEDAEKLRMRIQKLKELRPYSYTHTALKSNLHDFTCDEKHLSVKSCKSGWKICPQIIGQPTKKKFCEYFCIPIISTDAEIKSFIQNNLNRCLTSYFENTFHCDVVFYGKKQDTVQLIESKPIDWTNRAYELSRKDEAWRESTTLRVKQNDRWHSLGEFQVHAHRDCIKFRFNLKTLLTVFPDSFLSRII